MKRPYYGLFSRILPHLTLVVALLMLLLFIIDRFNNNMAFLTSELSKWMIGLLALLSLLTSLRMIARQWQDEDYADARKKAAEQRVVRNPVPKIDDMPRKSDVSAWKTDAPPAEKAAAAPQEQ